MILYTIMSEEFIYKTDIDYNESKKIVDYVNKKLEVVEIGGGMCKIISIISTTPSDFINPNIQPGRIIKI